MARAQHPDSAGSQFFIMHRDAPYLDGQYAAFGMLTDGFDVLDAIAGNRMADMQSQINALQLQAATSNVLRFPNSWTFAGGVFPPAAAAA